MPPRVLIAKPGLDGHDRGAKLVAYALRDAGFEIIYTGIRRRPEEIVSIAVQEDVDVVGLSILSGAHMTMFPRIMDLLKQKGADNLMSVILDCARCYCTEGEIIATLKEIFGEYQEPPIF